MPVPPAHHFTPGRQPLGGKENSPDAAQCTAVPRAGTGRAGLRAHTCSGPSGAPLALRWCPVRTAARAPSAQERACPASVAGPAAVPPARRQRAHRPAAPGPCGRRRRGRRRAVWFERRVHVRRAQSCTGGGRATTSALAFGFFARGRPRPRRNHRCPPLGAGQCVAWPARRAPTCRPCLRDTLARMWWTARRAPLRGLSTCRPASGPGRSCARRPGRLTADGNMPECACRMRPWPCRGPPPLRGHALPAACARPARPHASPFRRQNLPLGARRGAHPARF